MAFIRKVKTSSGATAVQIAYKQKGRIIKIIHIGSAHNKEELEILLALARKQYTSQPAGIISEPKSSLHVEYQTVIFWFIVEYSSGRIPVN